MRLELPQDDPRPARTPERKLPPNAVPKAIDNSELCPSDRHRAQRLAVAADKRFPEIPQRRYESRPRSGTDILVEHSERRWSRQRLPRDLEGLRLRDEERKLLTEVGKFRVVAVNDLRESVYAGNGRALESDLRFLKERGFVRIDQVNVRRDRRVVRKVERMNVVTLTERGVRVAQEHGDLLPDQKMYHGLVKPREVEHDAEIYRAYQKEAQSLESAGGRNLRVELDFELKGKIQRSLHAAQRLEPQRDLRGIKREVAQEHHLPLVDGQIQIPDARIHYEQGEGARSGFSDIEVVTAAYHGGHLRSKVAAGFRMYVSSRDAGRLGARIEDEHHTFDHILDL